MALGSKLKQIEAFLIHAFRRAHLLARRRLGTGQRAAVGVVFIVGGVFGFLPILGFWMIPLGVFLIMLEFPAARDWSKEWLYRRKRRLAETRPPKSSSG